MANKKVEANENYVATIREASRELTAKERVMFKDFANAISLVDFVSAKRESGEKAIIDIKDYVVIDVHNPMASDNTDYTVYLVIDSKGDKYYTSSNAFWLSLIHI